MMRMAYIGENSLPMVEEDAAWAKANGYEGLEYNWWGDFKDVSEDTVRKMHEIHARHGVRVSMLGIWGWNHLSSNPAERAEAHKMMDKAISFAQILQADVLSTSTGDIPGEPLGRKVAEFRQVFPPFLERIQAAGCKPVFYAVHGNSFFNNLAAYEAVWEYMPEVKIKYDPANWSHAGEDYLEVVQRYGHKVGYVHIKEHLYMNGRLVSQPAAGMGDIQFPKVLAFLYEHGYDGWLSVEPHGGVWVRGEGRRRMLTITRRYIGQFLA